MQVATRHNNTAQIVLFVVLMAAVYLAERLNSLAAAHWERFSTQNYFDKQGVFVSTMWSMPLLLIGVVMLFQSLYNASSLLVQVGGMAPPRSLAPIHCHDRLVALPWHRMRGRSLLVTLSMCPILD
jgi:hypothetical protein